MQTQAILFPEINQASLETIALPPMQPADALVDVELSGVSVGTEVWALTGQRPPGDTSFPCAPGYQAVGVVREAGPEAQVKPGERIFFTASRLPEPYSQGNWMGSHVAVAVVDTAERPRRGYWARLPEGMRPEEAVLSALAAVSERGLSQAGVETGDFCVVLGQGMIGQMAAQIARIRGAQVLAVDIAPVRLELSARWSADTVWNPQDGDTLAEVRRHKPGGADLVVEASGNKALIRQTYPLLRERGRIVLQGWYPGDVAFNFHDAHHRRPTISIACGMDREANQRAIDWIAAGRMHLEPLMTHTFRPQQAAEAYEMMRSRPGEFLGVAFDWRQA